MDVDQDGRINEEDFISFLGVTNPAEHAKQVEKHTASLKELRAQVEQCTADAKRVMMQGGDSAGEQARELLKQRRLAELKIEAETAEMGRKEKESADGLRSYRALKSKVVQVSFQWKNPDFLLKNPDFRF